MDLYEYQAKELFIRHGVPTTEGDVCTTPAEADAVAARIGGPVVVKITLSWCSAPPSSIFLSHIMAPPPVLGTTLPSVVSMEPSRPVILVGFSSLSYDMKDARSHLSQSRSDVTLDTLDGFSSTSCSASKSRASKAAISASSSSNSWKCQVVQ